MRPIEPKSLFLKHRGLTRSILHVKYMVKYIKCLGLLGHAYKALSNCLMARIIAETDGFLSEWQAGFRQDRGCRDNIMVLRTIYDDVVEQGKQLCATYIDYSAAFITVSHTGKFIDETLDQAGASIKTR